MYFAFHVLGCLHEQVVEAPNEAFAWDEAGIEAIGVDNVCNFREVSVEEEAHIAAQLQDSVH
jgi:hypothetical protein